MNANATSTKITKTDMKNAYHAREKLEPAIDALRKIDLQSLQFGEEAIELQRFVNFLSVKLAAAVKVIEDGRRQYENRDVELIDAVVRRYSEVIESIKFKGLQRKGLISHHERKVNELLARKFSAEEIEKIIPCPVEQIAELDTETQALRDEEQKLSAYIADAPAYNESLLSGLDVQEIRRAHRLFQR